MSVSRRALIVGNTDGIGLALTRRLLREGWSVVGLSRRASPIEDGVSYRHAIADVSGAEYRPALQALLAREGWFDVCVYCVGIGQFLDVSDLAGEAGVFRVNLIGAVETATAVLPPLIAAGRGHFARLGFVDTKMAKAKARPFMITTERAVEVVLECLRRRPARSTYPKRMAALAWLLKLITSIRLWFA